MTASGLLWDTILKQFHLFPAKDKWIHYILQENAFHRLSPKSSHLIPKTQWSTCFMRSKFCLVKLKIIQDRFYVCLQGVCMNLNLSCIDTICPLFLLNSKAPPLSPSSLCIWKWSALDVTHKTQMIAECSDGLHSCAIFFVPLVLWLSSLIFSCEILFWLHRDLSSQRAKLMGEVLFFLIKIKVHTGPFLEESFVYLPRCKWEWMLGEWIYCWFYCWHNFFKETYACGPKQLYFIF